jgi:hypothetical protein
MRILKKGNPGQFTCGKAREKTSGTAQRLPPSTFRAEHIRWQLSNASGLEIQAAFVGLQSRERRKLLAILVKKTKSIKR